MSCSVMYVAQERAKRTKFGNGATHMTTGQFVQTVTKMIWIIAN